MSFYTTKKQIFSAFEWYEGSLCKFWGKIFIAIKTTFTIVLKKIKNHLFQFWLYIVDVEIKVVRNVILNNFDLSDRFAKVHRSPSRRIQSWQKFTIFLQFARISPTLEDPGRRTVHPSKLITEIKVVQNDISDNFYFDVNNVQPKLKEVIFYLFLKQW